MEMINFL